MKMRFSNKQRIKFEKILNKQNNELKTVTEKLEEGLNDSNGLITLKMSTKVDKNSRKVYL